jgi:hypothetical protein
MGVVTSARPIQNAMYSAPRNPAVTGSASAMYDRRITPMRNTNAANALAAQMIMPAWCERSAPNGGPSSGIGDRYSRSPTKD